ncbi:SCP-like protein [Ancylostoma caninum]|uniref:SCP-like protein n=1 Tax=Ancylostoma caninum TaxID=29170 RepID=A0A368FW03_ANCCA|nr:SCP-like protein [Ancylostoma caninum]
MCKDQTNLSSDPIRKTFRDQHNKRRSAVAKGTVKMGNNRMCRNATQMWKLEYKCELEASAYKAAQGCSKSASNTEGVDEVWHVFDNAMNNLKDAANQTVDIWYKEIKTGYMNQTTGSQNLWLPALNIPNFAKMVWDSHKEIGCAIVKCPSATKAVCHYSPATARYGRQIYAMGGLTCNLCTKLSAKCSEVGLCVKN